MANQFFCFCFYYCCWPLTTTSTSSIPSRCLIIVEQHQNPVHPIPSTRLHSTPLDFKSKTHTKYKSNKELASLCQQQIFLFQSVLQATVFMLSLLRPLAIIESFHPYPRSIARRGDHLSIYLISHLCIWTPVFGSIHWLWPTISFALRLIILIKLSYLQPGHA